MSKYLYGASVQGIQSFIFKTNKLQDIAGASELVEKICTEYFKDLCPNFDPEALIIGAAGNVKYLFDDKADCEKVVLGFPKRVMTKAPGITISQAVIEIDGELTKAHLDELEKALKAQRNKPVPPLEIGFMGLERDRRSGGVAYKETIDRKERKMIIDKATGLKLDASETADLYRKINGNQFVNKNEAAFDMDHIAKGENSWIAVMHADGNGLGMLLRKLGEQLKNKSGEEVKKAFATFSEKLEIATKKAAQIAYEKIVKPVVAKAEEKGNPIRLPIRPVLVGGDDVTIIIRADLAFDFTVEFLKNFEAETKKELAFLKDDGVNDFANGLTACAGIAYIKKSYPFHYGIELAEKLTSEAKQFSKDKDKFPQALPPSSLSFYKVQSSFVEDLKDMRQRTMIAEKSGNLDFSAGPYLIHENGDYPNVQQLAQYLKNLKADSKADAKLRQWLGLLEKDKSAADLFMKRWRQIDEKSHAKYVDVVSVSNNNTTTAYELLQLHSF